jgi:signal transduction histidine kinase
VALAELAERISSSGQIVCRFEHSDSPPVADPVAAGHLYRIAQEAVNNAIRHGRATEILVRLGEQKGDTFLSVNDNGEGMPKAAARDRGVGLRVMRHRANIIGAALDIASPRGSGVTVTCTIPKRP